MKKTYNAPSVRITRLQSVQMIANSLAIENKTLSGASAAWAKEDNGWWDEDED